MSDLIDRTSIIPLWHDLGGGDLRNGRGQAFWRDGDGYNVALDSEKNTWYDFVAGEGGGLLDLIETGRACSRADAIAWLCEYHDVAPTRSSPATHKKSSRAGLRNQLAQDKRRRIVIKRNRCWDEANLVDRKADELRADGSDRSWELTAAAVELRNKGAAFEREISALDTRQGSKQKRGLWYER